MTIWKRLITTLLFCNMIWTVSVHAEEAPLLVQNSPEAVTLSEVLVDVNYSEAALENALKQITTAMFAQQPDLRALETEYPGMKQVFVVALRPIIEKELMRIRPLYVADLATLFQTHFTAAELQKLSKFWQSPPAQSLLKSATLNLDYSAMSTEIVNQINKDEEIILSQAAVDKDIRGAIKDTVANTGEADRVAFMRFATAPEGTKFLKLKDAKKAVDLKWMNAPTPPEVDEEIEAVVLAAMESHMRQIDERKVAKPVT